MCTRDNRHTLRVGNLRNTPFSELWWGPEMAARRDHVAHGDYGGLTLCQTCFIPRSSNYTDVGGGEIAAHAGWERGHHGPRAATDSDAA
jgi:hypothetical protein